MEQVKEVLSIAISVIAIISGLVTIYLLVFKGAKKNLEQDHKIDNLEKGQVCINKDIKTIKDDIEPIKLDIREIKTTLKIRQREE